LDILILVRYYPTKILSNGKINAFCLTTRHSQGSGCLYLGRDWMDCSLGWRAWIRRSQPAAARFVNREYLSELQPSTKSKLLLCCFYSINHKRSARKFRRRHLSASWCVPPQVLLEKRGDAKSRACFPLRPVIGCGLGQSGSPIKYG
jgi:hypothetical protein